MYAFPLGAPLPDPHHSEEIAATDMGIAKTNC